jgi:hypothetical protein
MRLWQRLNLDLRCALGMPLASGSWLGAEMALVCFTSKRRFVFIDSSGDPHRPCSSDPQIGFLRPPPERERANRDSPLPLVEEVGEPRNRARLVDIAAYRTCV